MTSIRLVARIAGAAAAVVLAAGVTAAVAPPATAALECTNQQPYPDSPLSICTGYGQSCARSICAYPPGTPGKWGTDGHYTPCTYKNGC